MGRTTGQPAPALRERQRNVIAIDRWRAAHSLARRPDTASPMPATVRLLRLPLGCVLLALGVRALFSPLPHTIPAAVAGVAVGGYFLLTAFCWKNKRL
jgi:hypothetical protein